MFWVHFALSSWGIEQLLEVKDFDDGGHSDFELVTDDQDFCGAVVEFNVFEFEREAHEA